jgi:hypothetical protein
MYGANTVGLDSQNTFKAAMRATLVKERRDQEIFEQFFPLFFGSNTPLMNNIPDNLSQHEQKMLEKALRSLAGQLAALKDLLRQLVDGRPFSDDELNQMGKRSGLDSADDMKSRPWLERRMRSQADLQRMQAAIEMLIEKLKQMGMDEGKAEELRDMLEENLEGLSDQVSNFTGRTLADRMADQDPKPSEDVMDIPFQHLSDDDIDQIRREIRRLAAKLRSRASLRHKRSKDGQVDPRRTMRANMKYQGVPVELKRKTRHIKPCLVLICDVSTSVRYCAEFLLTLIYELQDQVARTNSFIFIGDLVDISMDFKEHEPLEAVTRVLQANPPGYYSTDLGSALNTFKRDQMGLITGRTTVIILGDGRNNHNDPRIDIAADLHRKSRRLIWFNPEHPSTWGTGDSDMLEYAPVSDGVYHVQTLRHLADAVDKVLADG